jgi:hypothetical protein
VPKPPPSVRALAREVLAANPALTNDDVVSRVIARGVKAPAAAVRHAVHNARSELKKAGLSGKIPAAARSGPVTVAGKSGPVRVAPAPAARPGAVSVAAKSGPVPVPKTGPGRSARVPVPAAAAPTPGVGAVLANVALVDRVAGQSGGVQNARQVAEAVRACGGVNAFLQILDAVAGIKK